MGRRLEHLLDACAVFLERARAAKPDTDLAGESAAAVAELCRALEGLPLAIELAAARVRTLTVEQILERMADRFALLSRVGRASSGRHRALRTTIDWSFNLLSPAERAMLMRLSVFEGGWTAEAAEGVCFGPGGSDDDALEFLNAAGRQIARACGRAAPRDPLPDARVGPGVRGRAPARSGR